MDSSLFDRYDPLGFYCEMLQSAASRTVRERLSGLSSLSVRIDRKSNAEIEELDIGAGGALHKRVDR